MDKVFCDPCKYYQKITRGDGYGFGTYYFVCTYEMEKEITYKHNRKRVEYIAHDPEERNANNDCHYYEVGFINSIKAIVGR